MFILHIENSNFIENASYFSRHLITHNIQHEIHVQENKRYVTKSRY